MLALEVPVEADEEDHDADAYKGRAERFAQMSQFGRGVGIKFCGAEELVQKRRGRVVGGIVNGVFLALEDGLDVRVNLWREAGAHEGAQG